MRGKWLLISGTVLLLAIAAGALSLLRQRRQAGGVTAAAALKQAQPSFTGPDISLPGTIRAQTVVPVPVPVEGTVETLLVEVGQQVYEGQLLGRIQNSSLDSAQQAAAAELEQVQTRLSQLGSDLIALRLEASRARADANRVQADFDRAERTYLRQQMLHREGATPRLVYEKSAADYQAAKTERDSLADLARAAEDRLSTVVKTADSVRKTLAEKEQALDEARTSVVSAEIHSPVNGLVVARSRQAGDVVNPDVQDLYQIAVNLSSLEAVVEPEPPALARVRVGQEAIVSVADAPDLMVGRVKEIKGNQVIVEFNSPNPAVRPGNSAQVRIKLT